MMGINLSVQLEELCVSVSSDQCEIDIDMRQVRSRSCEM